MTERESEGVEISSCRAGGGASVVKAYCFDMGWK
jgi:hypothetical protein